MVDSPVTHRTTPRWLQIPILLGLAAIAAYFAACFSFALGPALPAWSMWGNWQMFSTAGRTNSALDAELLVDGAWVAVDLETLFPSRWESGPRYRMLQNNPARLGVVADSACDRDPRRPTSVRLFDVRWPIVIGHSPYLRENAKRKKVLEWKCSSTARRPKGRRI